MINQFIKSLNAIAKAHGINVKCTSFFESMLLSRATGQAIDKIIDREVGAEVGQSPYNPNHFFIVYSDISTREARQLLEYFSRLGDQDAFYFCHTPQTNTEKREFVFEVNAAFASTVLRQEFELAVNALGARAQTLLSPFALLTSTLKMEAEAQEHPVLAETPASAPQEYVAFWIPNRYPDPATQTIVRTRAKQQQEAATLSQAYHHFLLQAKPMARPAPVANSEPDKKPRLGS